MDDDHSGRLASLPHRGDELHLLREVLRAYQTLTVWFGGTTGVSGSRFGLMRLIAAADGGTGVAELARRLGVDPAAVTRQVQDLERDGLLQRRADPRDGRRSVIGFTAAGWAEFERLHACIHALETELADEIGVEALQQAVDVLARLRTFVDGRRRRAGSGNVGTAGAPGPGGAS